MNQAYAEILDNFTIAPGYRKMTLGCETPFGAAQPGQFVMLSIGAGGTPLLRRPFSIHRMVPGASGRVKLEILYKVVGEGTDIMARMPVGAIPCFHLRYSTKRPTSARLSAVRDSSWFTISSRVAIPYHHLSCWTAAVRAPALASDQVL
jgi:hypothetical protein